MLGITRAVLVAIGNSYSGGIDHVGVHPKVLHSNATGHKWALGAFIEHLDDALDEVSNGAAYVKIDMLKNMKDENRMLLIEDGNGIKTSTMRLGADAIVFSRCRGNDGKKLDYERREGSWNQSIRFSSGNYKRNLETIIQWSPFSAEEDLFQQSDGRIWYTYNIYNLWEDDQGFIVIDLDADPYDIQLRRVNRDKKNI